MHFVILLLVIALYIPNQKKMNVKENKKKTRSNRIQVVQNIENSFNL